MVDFIACTNPPLKNEEAKLAAELSHELFPFRYPNPAFIPDSNVIVQRLTADISRLWGDGEQAITVAFRDSASVALRNKVLKYANKWNLYCNKSFVYSKVDPMVRVDFGGGGYWSYLGTDVLGIPKNQQTMNLEGFTVNTPESEWDRVVPHEFGHTLGFPHEHMRPELVALLDVEKTVKYFRQTQGWSREEVMDQVLTPLNKKSFRGTPNADDTSIMCYQLPGSITKTGKPIRGGDVLSPLDIQFVSTLYPKAVAPPVEPDDDSPIVVTLDFPTGLAAGSYDVEFKRRK